MTEALITCVCRDIRLPDLGLVLRQGETATVDAGAAQRSADLQRAKHFGGVTVQLIRPCRERRPAVEQPAPVVVHRERPLARPPAHESAPARSRTLGEEVRDALRAEMPGVLREVLAGVALAPAAPQMTPAAQPGTVAEAATPRFIPEGLVPGDVKGDVAVQQAEAEGGGVDNAAAALRKHRKRG